ncbi:unnamed protein product [Trifolium pratense]|uniref:Uncharacterized protein n=1 Tax=Trifolium pratense TaxID=57577 RepID=A0ACB0KBQ8_TRIPR|nr:unnamed protein product [Trifolium pratense]
MAENSDFLKPSIPKFDGYYDHWAMLMENLLRSKEYWSLIENGVTVAPANATVEQQRIANEKTILNRDTARDIGNAMRIRYQGSTKVKRAQLQALRKDFEVLEMGESESVEEYFARTMFITNKMTSCGERVEQSTVVEKILRSMTAKFNHVVCSIELSSDVTTLSIDELQSSLIVHEQRMKGQLIKQEEQALKVTNGGRGRGRGRNSNSARGRGRGRQSKENVECFHCHKLGHYQSNCPNWSENANYAELDEFKEEMLLMAKTNDDEFGENWFLDSGCSNHMSSNKDWFYDFDENYRDSVKLGDDSRMNVMGKGNVKLSINGRVHVFTNVYFIPGLKTNLLSIGQIQQKKATIVFKNNCCKVYHEEEGLLFATYMSTNRMYIVKAEVIAPRCLQASKLVNSLLWHSRYGHLSIKGLNVLVKKDMVRGLPALKELDENCADCLEGKQHRDAIPKQPNWRASSKLELVHSDICGPINPKSNSGNRYFITFTNDLTRKTWIYLLKEKSSSLETFKQFKAMVEKESSCSIQCLRTDRGGEYTSNAFNDFCSNHGIKRQLTAAYTPQQNGVSERKNKTLMNMVRSMLAGKGVPKPFWPEALKWATYVMNRSPTLSIKDITPEEAWSGVKPSVHHFRVFGCIAFVHVPDSQRTKLDSKSVKCVLLGLSEESKAYKLYDPEKKKIIISRDVVFEENKGWNWNKISDKKQNQSSNDVLSDEEYSTSAPANDNEAPANDNEVQAEVDMNTSSDDSDGIDFQSEVNLPPRVRRPPQSLNDFVTGEELDQLHNLAVYVATEDPTSFSEVVKSKVWIEAMNQEMQSIEKNQTWELTSLPDGANVIGVKWIYKTKHNEKGEIDKHKARLVAKGYNQKHGIDYDEVFAPVARWDTIRSILAIAARESWKVFQLDVKSAFLHGELSEDIYVEQPPGYQREKNKVYKLKKALYGLKQAPRAWYSRIEAYFNSEEFEKCPSEHTLFIKHKPNGKILIVSLYVDDLIYTGNDLLLMNEFKTSMQKEFSMTDLGKMKFFLGVEVIQSEEGIYISQQKYAAEVLGRFGMENCNSVCSPIVPGCKLDKDEDGDATDAREYKQIVGSLMYLLATRPDLAYSVCLVARYMERPTNMHLTAVKRILRHLKGTLTNGIMYRCDTEKGFELVGWSDSDYAGDVNDRKSTTGFVFMLGSGAISWSSKKQPIVTLSTTEAEYVAAAACACQAVWLRSILSYLLKNQKICTQIYCDNSSSIKLSKNPIMHGRCKHIDVRFHFLRDLTKDGTIELKHCKSQDQLADIMTKPLKLDAFLKLRSGLGMEMK